MERTGLSFKYYIPGITDLQDQIPQINLVGKHCGVGGWLFDLKITYFGSSQSPAQATGFLILCKFLIPFNFYLLLETHSTSRVLPNRELLLIRL